MKSRILFFFINKQIKIYKIICSHRIIGLFTLTTPFYIIRDPELIKKIAVKDFDHFSDHTKLTDDKSFDNDMLSKVLTALTGQKWKDMRSTLSPAFTTSKMRQMLDLIIDCSEEVTKFFQNQSKSNNDAVLVLDMKETFSKFTNDVIATCAFGIKVNSFEKPDNEFYQQGKRILNPSKLLILISVISFLISPKLIKWFRLDNEARKLERFFQKLIIDTMEIRERENIYRPDMINLLMQLRKGNLKDDDEMIENEGFSILTESEQSLLTAVTPKKIEWKDDELVAQCVQFFLAGYETSSLVLSFASHALATHMNVQQKLIEEIDNAFEKSNGKLNYSELQSLKYMDMVISEVLRLWPPAILTDRVCVKDYIYDDGNGKTFTIEKGMGLFLPIFPLHYDPKYFHDPEKFDPERFNEVNAKNIISGSYIPFGYGPRSCIGK